MNTANAWHAPDNPHPLEIMQSGVQDAMAGRHAVALAKFTWFHHNAHLIESALTPVRLSFALMYWHQLADDYPPAMTALLEARDQAESSYLNDGYRADHFHDLATLNDKLDEPQRTVEIFKHISQQDSEAAASVYIFAEPTLVSQGEFEVCNPFLEPKERVRIALQGFRLSRRSESRYGFSRNLATLVALLVLNNRVSEAEAVANEVRATLPDYPHIAQLESALAGDIPPPWP